MAKTPSTKVRLLGEDSRAVDIYFEALDRPVSERHEYIRKAAKGDGHLVSLVEALLTEEGSPGFMESPAIAFAPSFAAGLAVPHSHLAPGSQFGDFRILRQLGQGGLATVYLATQLSLDREVALKVTDHEFKEAKILAHVEHDNIVKVFAEGYEPKTKLYWLAMQYIAGATLTDQALTSQGDLDYTERVLLIGIRIADALAYAHQKGILHLDVKPCNILMNEQGEPFLTDFNISLDPRDMESSFRVKGGTPAYMAPEQAGALSHGNATVDHRADIFSLGVILRDLILLPHSRGPKPSEDTSLQHPTIILKVQDAGEWSKVDAGIRAVIRQSIAPFPENRFQSADELGEALANCLEMRRIAKAMPHIGKVSSFRAQFPASNLNMSVFFSLTLASVASLFATVLFYPESHAETLLRLGVGMVASVFVFFIWRAVTGSLLSFLRSPFLRRDFVEESAYFRQKALTWEDTVSWVIGLLWLPLMASAQIKIAPLSQGLLGRELLAIGFFGLLSVAFLRVRIELTVLRFLYPKLCLGHCDLQGELAPRRHRFRVSFLILSGLPLALTFLLGRDPLIGEHRDLAVAIATALGLLGMGFSFWASHQLSDVLGALNVRAYRKPQ